MSFYDLVTVVGFFGFPILIIALIVLLNSPQDKGSDSRKRPLKDYAPPFAVPMTRDEVAFANEAHKLLARGVDAKRAETAYRALTDYEALYQDISSRQKLVSDHIYQEDIADIRENYEALAREEWASKADRILDRFYNLYVIITSPDFQDVEKAYRSKKQCIEAWQDYFFSVNDESGIWYDAKAHMKEYLGDGYDDCMFSHESLEKKLKQSIEEMRPEYKRKQKARVELLDLVAERKSIKRAELCAMQIEGCTQGEMEYMVKELVEKDKLVAVKIGNRYFVSLSDREKQSRGLPVP